MITVTISPFGHMREFFNEPMKITIADQNQATLRKTLLKQFPDAGHIIELCVFSDEKRILCEQEKLEEGAKLFILPPVCGG